MRSFLISVVLVMVVTVVSAAGMEILTPPEVWKGYDPDKGAYKEEIVKEWDVGNVHYKDFYISAYVNGEEIRMFCKYAAQQGATNLPAILDMHGWGGAPFISSDFISRGYAVMSQDYSGFHKDRTEYTKYPPSLKHGNQLTATWTADPDVRATSDYIWYALARRALSYMATQPEVDTNRMGANGFSYGGTIIWPLATDPRLKAVCAFHGVGWIKYYRDRHVWRYDLNPPAIDPTEDELIFLAGIAPQAYAPYINCPVLFLNGSNDHHGNQDRSYETLDLLPDGVPWATAQQVNTMHNTDAVRHILSLWMKKWVKGESVTWPNNPKSEIRIGKDGVPVFELKPDSPEEVESVEIYYAIKEPFNMSRNWRDTKVVKSEKMWTAKMPIIDADMYLFAYANVRYKSTIVLSSNFEAVVPSKIGKAIATDKKSSVMYRGSDGAGCWTPRVIPAVGPDGVGGFKSSRNHFCTGQPNDPKWYAPEGVRLSFKVFSKEQQSFTVNAEYFSTVVNVDGSDKWQTIIVEAKELENRFDKRLLAGWDKAKDIKIEGEKLKELIFTDFEWIK